ncbi:MAG TPA: glycosyltransferase family 4 protein, partial [Allocoleopsis sp.]
EIVFRRQYLWDALSPFWGPIDIFSREETLPIKFNAFKKKASHLLTGNFQTHSFHKSAQAFQLKSQQAEHYIHQLPEKPDLIFHLHGLWCPFWNASDIPYVMLLDYTMQLAIGNWSAWAPFTSQKEQDAWLACERRAYQRAHHLFPMSQVVKSSLVNHYGVDPNKITVVGSAGNFQRPYHGEKQFGSKRILFNGSDFTRKGGETVLAAFQYVKQQIPDATLVVVGRELVQLEDGIENPGSVSIAKVRGLLQNADLVLAPARCEPFGLFLVEAMNYGVPCIVSPVGGMPEIVEHNVSGIVLETVSPQELAAQIILLLSQPDRLEAMSVQARRAVATRFNWDSIAEKMVHALAQPALSC